MFQRRGDYHMTVGVKLPDGVFIAPVSNKFLVKYIKPGKETEKLDVLVTIY